MRSYHTYTPVRIAVPYILGIVIAHFGMPEMGINMFPALAVIVFTCYLVGALLLGSVFSFRWVPGFLGNLLLAIAGAASVNAVNLHEKDKDLLIGETSGETVMICKMEGRPNAGANSFSGLAEMICLMDSSGRWPKMGVKILLYFKKDSSCQVLMQGDLIMISGNIQAVADPMNPDMFNYRKYLKNRRVRWQLFIEPGHWEATGMSAANPVRYWSAVCRERFLEMLRAFRIEGNDLALASALLLGDKDLLEKDIRQEFSHAGAMHVLCVSGLHVGIMFVIAEKLLFFLKRGRKGRVIRQILILAWIWAYAFITGLSPSVMRAGLMFSLLAAGRIRKRKPENFNILAGAAFIQLCSDPYEITQVGFQLSYLAVLGIFAFYQKLNGLIKKQGRLLSWIWPVIAVSIAAQVATFPLAGYYFNIFPVYFIVTNLAVVPLSGLIIYLALGLFGAGAAGFAQEWLALPLQLSLRLLHGSVHTIQSWPGAVIDPVLLQPVQVLVLYLLLTGFFLLMIHSKRNGIFWIGTSLLLLSLTAIMRKSAIHQQTRLIVYNVRGHSAIDLIHQRQTIFLCDSLLADDHQKISSHIIPHRMRSGIRNVLMAGNYDGSENADRSAWISRPFVFFHGKRIAIVERDFQFSDDPGIIKTDMVIIMGAQRVNLERLHPVMDFNILIIDSSVPAWQVEAYKDFCLSSGIICHAVRQDGAFIMKW